MKGSLFHIIGLFGLLFILLGNKAQPVLATHQEKSCCTEQNPSHTESHESSCFTISPGTTDNEHTHCTNNCTQSCHCPISQISLFPTLLRSLPALVGAQEVHFAYFENLPSIIGSTIWNPPKKA